ncbi:Uncharacterised protein [Citrobacter freundii]|nr:Uncharacterised protein [Citrobacter freundii]
MLFKHLITICFFCIFLFSEPGYAKIHAYLEGSNLTASFSAVSNIPPFLKQGDFITIKTLTPPASVLYSGSLNWTAGDTSCAEPSAHPLKYEAYKWPESIEMGNMKLVLDNADSMGIVTGTAPRLCLDYQPNGGAAGTQNNREFVGNGMQARYRVSQIYQAGSSSHTTSIYVISGRTEYDTNTTLNKLKYLLSVFSPVQVTVTTNVKNWCSASVGPGRDILLSHGVMGPGAVNNNMAVTAIQLSCIGEGAQFQLKWFGEGSAGEIKRVDLNAGVYTEISIDGISTDGKVYVPVNNTITLNVKSTLKVNGPLKAGRFDASQILLIDVL